MTPHRGARVPEALSWRTLNVHTLHEKEESFCCVKLVDFRVCYLSFVHLVLTDSVMTIKPLKAYKKWASQTVLHTLVTLCGVVINLSH